LLTDICGGELLVKRREFLTKGLSSYLSDLVTSFDIANFLEDLEPNKKDYFESFFSCYPLLSEAPYDQLIDAANMLGIDVTNKSKLEIAKEIFGEKR